MAGWTLLIIGLLAFAAVLNARWPRRSLAFVIPSWFGAMVVVELALQLIVVLVIVAALLAGFGGALSSVVGWVGLVLVAAAVLTMLPHAFAGLRTTIVVDGRPEELDLASDAPRLPRTHSLLPLLGLYPRRGVSCTRGVQFTEVDGKRLKLDVYAAKSATGDQPLPALVWVHGGAWLFGTRSEQAVPMLSHMAANGWVCFSIDYRLSPDATMPEHIEDVKRAVGWVREHASEYGVDPSFIALSGGSAGGHLAAITGLTIGDAELQPGFEQLDTSVQAVVPFYGLYDLLDEARNHHPTLRHVLAWVIMKVRRDKAPDRYIKVSPMHRLRVDAPPFFIIHGDADTLVNVAESREFSRRLRDTSDNPVLYAEMAGGQHAFDIFSSVRTGRVLQAVQQFLALSYEQHRSGVVGEIAEEQLEQELTGG
jgi:acetyl esterase/lipase